jgi:hypothetical protein
MHPKRTDCLEVHRIVNRSPVTDLSRGAPPDFRLTTTVQARLRAERKRILRYFVLRFAGEPRQQKVRRGLGDYC